MPFYLKPGKHNPIKKDHWPTKEESLKMMSADPVHNADNIVELNNAEKQAQLGGGFGGGAAKKFILKEIAKKGISSNFGQLAGKAFGITAAMLNTNKAYGGQLDQTGHWENELKRGNSSAAKEYFFNDQYKNFDSQTDFQKDRLMRLNQKYDLGYSQKSLQSSKDVKPDDWD